ncbi:hypothetical protein PFISCL1PPCAC_21785, partial [Pristionchus fissidentatus]
KGEEKEEDEPVNKKRKIMKKTKKNPVSNGPKREMECPQCQSFRSMSVLSFISHFRSSHSTTPSGMGIRFLCDCGHKSSSNSHLTNGQCTILNFKIIHEKKLAQKCVLCETQLSSSHSYTSHLSFMHNSTLIKNGVHLVCSCGVRLNHVTATNKHSRVCANRQFFVKEN